MKIQSCRALSAAVRVSIISALVATGATAQMPDPADPIPPDAVFSDTISATMAQGHPRVQSLAQTLEALKQADLDEIYSHYQDRFADASDFTFYFVGAFRLDEIRPMVEQYLGSLPNLGRVENWVDVGVDPPSGVIEKVVHKGLEPQSQTVIIFAGDAEHSVQESSAMTALAGILRIRLRELLREDMGGTSVAKVRETQRRSKETSLEENEYWLSRLESFELQGRDFRDIPSYDLIESWTAEQVQQAAIRYLRTDQYAKFVLLPEQKVP